MALSQLVYSSEIVPAAFRLEMSLQSELEKMLVNARRRNQDQGLTGLLMYSGGHFLQVLEGEQRFVDRLFAKIETDKRHRNVQKLSLIKCDERLFSKWSMGLLNLDERRAMDQQIYARFMERLRPQVTQDEIADPLYELLADFKTFLDEATPAAWNSSRRSFAR